MAKNMELQHYFSISCI